MLGNDKITRILLHTKESLDDAIIESAFKQSPIELISKAVGHWLCKSIFNDSLQDRNRLKESHRSGGNSRRQGENGGGGHSTNYERAKSKLRDSTGQSGGRLVERVPQIRLKLPFNPCPSFSFYFLLQIDWSMIEAVHFFFCKPIQRFCSVIITCLLSLMTKQTNKQMQLMVVTHQSSSARFKIISRVLLGRENLARNPSKEHPREFNSVQNNCESLTINPWERCKRSSWEFGREFPKNPLASRSTKNPRKMSRKKLSNVRIIGMESRRRPSENPAKEFHHKESLSKESLEARPSHSQAS